MRVFARRLVTVSVLVLAQWMAGTAAADHQVVLQLRWDNQFQFAGYYAAKLKGYYKHAGLEVEIRPAVTEQRKILSATQEVAAGRAHFGVGGADVLVANEGGADLRIVAPIFQQSAVAVFARPQAELLGPADLARMRLRRMQGDITDAELQAVLRAEGLDPQTMLSPENQVWKGRAFDLLAQGKIDAYVGYSLTALWRARQAGINITMLRPATYGIDFYGDSLFVQGAYARNHPKHVQRFREASLMGWRYALENPDEIIDHIIKDLPRHFPIQNLRGFNEFQAREIRRLTHFPIVDVGHLNPARWRRVHETLKQAGLVRGDFSARQLIFDPTRDAELRNQFVDRLILIISLAAVLATLAVLIWVGVLRRMVLSRTAQLRELSEHLEDRVAERTRELTESQARLRHAQETANLGYWEWNIRTGERHWSEQLYRIFGLEPGTPAPDGKDILELVHPDDRDAYQSAQQKALAAGEPYDREFRIFHANGGTRTLSSRGQVKQDAEGRPISMHGTALDVTELRRAEETVTRQQERFRLVLDNALVGIITINERGVIQSVNRVAEQIFGYAHSELVGRDMKILMPEPDRSRHDDYIATYQETGISQIIGQGREVQACRSDGSLFTMQLAVSELSLGDEALYTGIVRDVTRENRLRQELIDAKVAAETSDRAKSEFLANMSHELRTPLNAILGFAQTIRGELFGPLGDPKYQEYATDIENSGSHLLELINEILDVSAIEAGKLELTEAEVTIADIEHSVCRLIAPRAEEKGISFICPTEVPEIVIRCDMRRIKQVLLNLMTNAVKYTPAGGQVELGYTVTNGEGLYFWVRDNGDGMSPDELQRALRPFEMVSRDYVRTEEGTGLGLPLAKSLIELHGGTLIVRSEVGGGTAVECWLPEERLIKRRVASNFETASV